MPRKLQGGTAEIDKKIYLALACFMKFGIFEFRILRKVNRFRRQIIFFKMMCYSFEYHYSRKNR
jgi:hypothetical protein